MRFLLKVLVAPVIAVLAVTVWLCTGLLYCAGMVMGLAGWGMALLGVVVLLTGSVRDGIILLILAFLLSPMGLISVAAWLLGRVQAVRYFIQDVVF